MTSRTTSGYQLPAAEGRAEYIRENFNAIAGTYDRFNDIITFGIHRRWKRKAVALTGLPRYRYSRARETTAGDTPGPRVLDLCSGSGDLSVALARYLGPHALITAMDYSPGMLEVLRQRLAASTESTAIVGKIEIVEGDATDLSRFADASLDAITIGFGLRNVQNRAACLKECYRVLKADKHLIILDVGKVQGRITTFFHNFYFERIVPLIGHFLQGKHTEMSEYLPASARVYPGPAELSEELLAAGFRKAPFFNVMMGAAVIHMAVK